MKRMNRKESCTDGCTSSGNCMAERKDFEITATEEATWETRVPHIFVQ